MMDIKLIKTNEEYQQAVNQLEKWGDQPGFETNEQLIAQFESLSKLIRDYELEHFSVQPGHPIEIIRLKMKYLGITRKALSPAIGSSGVVSEVLNKKRGLSKNMIRHFSQLLDIDQNLLNTPYELAPKLSKKTSIHPTLFAFIGTLQQEVDDFSVHVRRSGMILNVCNYRLA